MDGTERRWARLGKWQRLTEQGQVGAENLAALEGERGTTRLFRGGLGLDDGIAQAKLDALRSERSEGTEEATDLGRELVLDVASHLDIHRAEDLREEIDDSDLLDSYEGRYEWLR